MDRAGEAGEEPGLSVGGSIGIKLRDAVVGRKGRSAIDTGSDGGSDGGGILSTKTEPPHTRKLRNLIFCVDDDD